MATWLSIGGAHVGHAAAQAAASSRDSAQVARFEATVEGLRTRLRIPGMSAVIVRNQEVHWAGGFGFADVANEQVVTPRTLFHIASLTKTFAATLILQLAEQGRLELTEPVARYAASIENEAIQIRHLLSHTSQGTPGNDYQYDGRRFDLLTAVIEAQFGMPFLQVMVQRFLDPLGMSHSVPAHDVADESNRWVETLGPERLARYRDNLSRLAVPYTLYGDSDVVLAPYPRGDLGASAGLLSTVVDLAAFDAAIDRHTFLASATQEQAWTPFVSNDGRPLPHGLGWFVTEVHGIKVIWHYGHWGRGYSAIYVKVPARDVSLIMLANSEALADHQFQVGQSITSNVFACSFLRLFVFEDAEGRRLPEPRWDLDSLAFRDEVRRMQRQSGEYTYDCDRDAHLALTRWLGYRRASARQSVRVAPEVLDAYVGRYRYDPPSTQILTVRREGDRLLIDIPSDQWVELFGESPGQFFFKVYPVHVTFVMQQDVVTHIEFSGYGERWRAMRVR